MTSTAAALSPSRPSQTASRLVVGIAVASTATLGLLYALPSAAVAFWPGMAGHIQHPDLMTAWAIVAPTVLAVAAAVIVMRVDRTLPLGSTPENFDHVLRDVLRGPWLAQLGRDVAEVLATNLRAGPEGLAWLAVALAVALMRVAGE